MVAVPRRVFNDGAHSLTEGVETANFNGAPIGGLEDASGMPAVPTQRHPVGLCRRYDCRGLLSSGLARLGAPWQRHRDPLSSVRG